MIVAVHSSAVGQAAGGCRVWRYPSWRDGLNDALRLSRAMTYKFVLPGLPIGGGKTVIALKEGAVLSPEQRREVLLDVGDVIEGFGGRYGVAEDVGTSAEDMLVIRERTKHVYCLPTSAGGIGDPSQATADGVFDCLRRAAIDGLDWQGLADLTVTIVGLGHVGQHLARQLTEAGVRLKVSDIDVDKKAVADEVGAEWIDAASALTAPCDILVPAALGGFLTADLVPQLACRAIVGPANNQLADDSVAELLAARDILWGPDFLVNAGGAVYGAVREILGGDEAEAMGRVRAIADSFSEVLERSRLEAATPLAVANRMVAERLQAAK